MIRSFYWKLLTALALSALLVACGGGGGGGTSGGTSAGTSSGVITGFGSVVVNGVKFDDNGTDILLVDEDDASSSGDKAGTRDDLEVGMVVEVENETRGKGRHANEIRIEKIVTGLVQTVTPTNSTLLVLGQTVLVDAQTSFTGRDRSNALITDITGLAPSDFVEVSGFSKPDGSILATLIQKKNFQRDVTTLKVKGKISNLRATTFTINAQVVDFASVPALITPNGTILKVDDLVAVKSKLTPAILGDTLVAQKVRVKNSRLQTRDGHKIEIEGIIESIINTIDTKTFVINGITVDGSNLPGFGALAAGQKIEVEGVMVNGILVPTKAKNEQESSIRVEAPIQSLGADSITALGVTFNVNEFTRFEDKVSRTRPFNKENFATVLLVGDSVAIRGFKVAADDTLTATRIERVESRDFVSVQGPLTSKAPSSAVTILGVTVNIGPSTHFNDPLTLSTLFSDLTPIGTTLLKAEGVVANDGTPSALDATEIEIENDD